MFQYITLLEIDILTKFVFLGKSFDVFQRRQIKSMDYGETLLMRTVFSHLHARGLGIQLTQ